MAAAQARIKLALVGTGAELAKAVEPFNGLPMVEIVAVVDVQDRGEGARFAQRLGLVPAKNPTDVFSGDTAPSAAQPAKTAPRATKV